jgi:type IV secretory pathway VirB2 component (pilin)
MQGLATWAQTIATFITGPFGISIMTIAIAGIAAMCALRWMRWPHLFEAMIAGALLFSAGTIVTSLQ